MPLRTWACFASRFWAAGVAIADALRVETHAPQTPLLAFTSRAKSSQVSGETGRVTSETGAMPPERLGDVGDNLRAGFVL